MFYLNSSIKKDMDMNLNNYSDVYMIHADIKNRGFSRGEWWVYSYDSSWCVGYGDMPEFIVGVFNEVAR